MELPVGRGLGLVLIAFCFLVILQDLQDDVPNISRHAQRTAEAERHAIDILNHSKYGTFDPERSAWINVTCLREDDALAWHLLPKFHETIKAQAQASLSVEFLNAPFHPINRGEFHQLGERYRSVDSLDDNASVATAIPYYGNITGFLRGEWARSSIQGLAPLKSKNITSQTYEGEPFARNITGSYGRLYLRLDEKEDNVGMQGSAARVLKAEMSIEDKSGYSWDISLKGIHFTESGSAILSSSSERFAGLNALPHLTRSEGHFQLARKLLNATAMNTKYHFQSSLNPHDAGWDLEYSNDQEDIFQIPKCDYVVYLQQHLIWPYETTDHDWMAAEAIDIKPKFSRSRPESNTYLQNLERELRWSTGKKLRQIPELSLSATIMSPDCGFVLESATETDKRYGEPGHQLKGCKVEVCNSQIRRDVLIYALVVLAQVLLLTRQIKDSSTPSTRSRISYLTIAMMAMADGAAGATALLLSALIRSAQLPFISVTFFLFLCVPFFGLKFFIDLWSIQAPEREDRERQQIAARQSVSTLTPPLNAPSNPSETTNNATTVLITPAGADLLPLPVTARRNADSGATPVILPPDQDIDAMIAEDELLGPTQPVTQGTAHHHRFNIGLKFLSLSFCLTILSYIASFWPMSIRSLYTNVLVFCYLSFWVPQIRRNMLRNCRKALQWEFVVGQSVLRLVPLAYFYCYEDNIQSSRTDIRMFGGFLAWQWAQILLLLSQDVLGPRFFLPAGILPPAYDYHQVLREGDEEDAGFMPVGFTQDRSNLTGESKEKGKWTTDCIICMNPLEAPFVSRSSERQQGSASAAAVSNIFARRDYMITPCRHIFHSRCLDGWMKYKLQCPICRETLPPL